MPQRMFQDTSKVTSPPVSISNAPPQRIFQEQPKVTSPPVLISKLVRVNSVVDEKTVVQKTFKPDVVSVKVKVEKTVVAMEIEKHIPKPEESLKAEKEIQKGEKLVPKVEKEVPKVEKEVPKVEKEVPKVHKEIPKVESVVPKVEEVPKCEQDPLECDKEIFPNPPPVANDPQNTNKEENNGVGDKIKIFEKAAENAASAGRLSRPGSMRRPRTERLPSDELPPPPAELSLSPAPVNYERQPSFRESVPVSSSIANRWPRSDGETSDAELPRPRPEPQRIVRPEFRPLASPAEVTIRSPSLGAKIPDRFPSHGTAFRNVASTPPVPNRELVQSEDDEHHKACKAKKERYSVSRGSSYFTRGSEEIWLVKKKDIEEIEERVLDSLRRSGGAATLGRGRRQMYARSESLEPTSVSRAHTLKRQSSVACTCGHDKKTRARSADATTPRARSRSHGDDNAHVLDKYETLV